MPTFNQGDIESVAEAFAKPDGAFWRLPVNSPEDVAKGFRNPLFEGPADQACKALVGWLHFLWQKCPQANVTQYSSQVNHVNSRNSVCYADLWFYPDPASTRCVFVHYVIRVGEDHWSLFGPSLEAWSRTVDLLEAEGIRGVMR
jgi:hypothetical protein